MKIKHIEVSNWRSIKKLEIQFNNIMMFIGQNNHGKSNILTAMLFFFGYLKHDDLDFNNKNDKLYIEILFDELDNFDKTQFKKYLTTENTFKVRKEGFQDGTFEYHGYLETPTEEWLKEDNINENLKRDIAQLLPLYDLLPESGRITKDIFKDAQEAYINQHRDELIFNYQLETGSFLGFKNVAKGIFGEVFYIPSVKDASSELNCKGSTAFNQLYSTVINKMSESNSEYRDAKNKIISLMSILNKTTENGEENLNRPVELQSLENNLEIELSSWDTKIDVEITPPDIEEIFKVGTNVWIDDGIRTDISRKGHGLQRALIFALIKAWAKVLKQERENANSQDDESSNSSSRPRRKASNSTYFIFEEPELYLHPQAQKELFSSLQNLSDSNNQVLLCTHSSSFIDLNLYKSICVVKKKSIEEGTTIFQYLDELFPVGNEKKKFNMMYWINPDRSELFFAKKVILLEGATDKTVVPYLAEKINKFNFDYTVIDCGSKTAIPIYINLLNKFSIPYTVVYDKDHQAYKNPDQINAADRDTNLIIQAIDNNLGNSVVFENDIEEELGIIEKSNKNKPYFALTKVEDPNFNLTSRLSNKIEQIYD